MESLVNEIDRSQRLDDSGPLLCPNNCGKILERKSLENHISTDCPMTVIDCEFKHIGCDVRLPRKDMLMHTEQAVIYHLKKQVGNYEQRIKTLEADNKKLSVRCEVLEAQHKELVGKVGEAFDKISRLVDKQDDRTHDSDDNQEYINMDEVYESTPTEDYSYVSAIKPSSASSVPNLITNFTMTNFQVHKENNDHWVSRPFYTHSQGYKMCLRVTANGQGSGKGTHITVAVYLMKGEFDNQLEWPFRGDITIQLLNQREDGAGHYARTIYQAKGERSKASVGEKYISGWGINKFLTYSELFPRYLQNDSLRFHVSIFVKSKPSPETEV
jgi:TNF receptor-associated factor 4